MGYRNELDAARARVRSLEDKVAELEAERASRAGADSSGPSAAATARSDTSASEQVQRSRAVSLDKLADSAFWMDATTPLLAYLLFTTLPLPMAWVAYVWLSGSRAGPLGGAAAPLAIALTSYLLMFAMLSWRRLRVRRKLSTRVLFSSLVLGHGVAAVLAVGWPGAIPFLALALVLWGVYSKSSPCPLCPTGQIRVLRLQPTADDVMDLFAGRSLAGRPALMDLFVERFDVARRYRKGAMGEEVESLRKELHLYCEACTVCDRNVWRWLHASDPTLSSLLVPDRRKWRLQPIDGLRRKSLRIWTTDSATSAPRSNRPLQP